ncbi:MAG TPA: 3-hydroxyacyl-CoA dehydrogenase [Beijerinckiaceae bacterium]|jgi:3-hydroxybutyryl-CoA dehydrogenase
MSFDASRPDLTLGIVGAGVMGRGIAQVAAEAGLTVLLADADPKAGPAALDFCADMIRRKAAKGQLAAEAAEAAIARIHATEAGPERGYAAFQPCHLVIEAAAERMDVKHAVLAGVEAAVSGECVIATNTSSLSVTGFAAGAKRPERIAGYHFFNPVPLMRLVEVIGGALTAPTVLDALEALAHRLGHQPVRASDTPGFLVNHAGRAFGTEALRIHAEGVAGFADIDRVMTQAAGFRMGPFELLDLTGLDVSHAVMETVYRQFYEEPRFRPQPLTGQRVTAGLLGRKTGRGFYAYPEGKPEKPPERPVPPLPAALPPVWVAEGEGHDALRAILAATGAALENGAQPSERALILVTPLGDDATTTAVEAGLDPTRTVAVDPLFGFARRRTLMTTPVTAPAIRDCAHALLAADGTPVTVIHDSPGFIAQRIVAAIVNVGADIAQQRIATPDAINQAVRLGLGYPKGPLEFGDALGARKILAILEGLHRFTGDPRYRPSPWLKRRALLGAPLTLAEA